MSILVTGANGFLGRAVVERLCARKVPKLRCFVRPTSNRSALDELQREYPGTRLEYVVGNLTSGADCHRALDGVKLVFHLAAQMKGAPASLFLNTVVASRRLIEAMLESGPKRIVLVSSMAVYGPMDNGRGPVLDEDTPLELCPEKRDVYAQTKIWQESLFRKLREEDGYELVALRPGVIYGQGGQEFSSRVGITIGNWMWRFGRNNLLPLTYVQNCAEAVVMAGLQPGLTGCYNVVDDDKLTAGEYLREYRQRVKQIRGVWIPWWFTRGLSRAVEAYSKFSRGQLPPVLTPYRSAVLWRGCLFDNSKLKSLGWMPIVSTAEALALTFGACKHEARDRHQREYENSVCAAPSAREHLRGLAVEDG